MLSRKKKVFILAAATGAVAPLSIGVVHSLLSSNNKEYKFNIKGSAKTFVDNDTADISKAVNGSFDSNLPRKPKEPEPIKKPEPKPITPVVEVPIVEEPQPETKPEPKPEPAPIPTPQPEPQPIPEPEPIPVPTPEPEPVPKPQPEPEPISDVNVPIYVAPEPKPQPEEIEKEIRTRKKIKKDEIEYFADIVEFPPRKDKKSDVERGITNRVPYRAEILPDVENISGALTEENIRNSVNRAIRHGKSSDQFFGKGSTYREVLENDDKPIEEKIAHYNADGNSPEHFSSLWFRYYRLLKGGPDVLKKYLDEEGLKNLDKWWNDKRIFSWTPPRAYEPKKIPLGHLLLIMHIDHTKITKISDMVKRELEKGNVIPKDHGNVGVNENGEWEAYNYEPPINGVVGEIKRNNKFKRVLGNNNIWSRSAEDIERGKFHNWNDRDVTEFYRQKYGFGTIMKRGGGIYVTEYTRNEKIDGVDRDKAIVVTIDVLSKYAYENAEAVIKRFKEKEIEITGYRMKNIGKKGATQSMEKILSALPKKLPMLELFFESKNTSDLKYLKNKEIDELSMISNSKVNTLADDWAFNPWALNKVAWVNMADYNVSSDYNKDLTIYSRITFDNLAFDPEDYKEGDLTAINNGLRMAYWVRNNERIFQGGFGPGLKPDRDAGGNSYPMGIDLSRIPQMKTLRGLIFYNEDNPSQIRKLNKIKLFNDSDTWTVSTVEMNEAQFADILVTSQPQMPRSKIMFSNGSTTQKIKILPTRNTISLNSDGIRHLKTLLSYSENMQLSISKTEIIVPNGATSLFSTLKNAGFKVRFESADEDDLYIP
ncbi:putative immunoglobulin-blocking virulence protein [Mycoplasmopsis edwardii]|nr:putative immunoglobulin-blocking virulence protein [Mycoplasmopsis edwardii]